MKKATARVAGQIRNLNPVPRTSTRSLSSALASSVVDKLNRMLQIWKQAIDRAASGGGWAS